MKNEYKELQEEIKKLKTDKNGKIRVDKTPNLFKRVINATSFLNSGVTNTERVYCIMNNIIEVPTCKNPNCNCKVNFNIRLGKYEEYCRNNCTKIRKEEPSTIAGCRRSMKEKYGCEYPLQNKEARDKAQKSLLKRGFKTFNEKAEKAGYTLLNETEDTWRGQRNQEYFFKCHKCNHEFSYNIDSANRKLPICPKCNLKTPASVSKIELNIREYISSIYSGKIVYTDKMTLGSRIEMDIYLPDLKLGIEVDGLYFHSEEHGKDEFYHLNKTNIAKTKGIKLIHIFEDEWLTESDSIKSILNSIINPIICNSYSYKLESNKIIISNKDKNVLTAKINNHLIYDIDVLDTVDLKNIVNILAKIDDFIYLEDDNRFNLFDFLIETNQYSFIKPYKWTADLHLRDKRFNQLNDPFKDTAKHLNIWDCGYMVYEIVNNQ